VLRQHGHNESDEPKFTQPKLTTLLQSILTRASVVKKLIERGELTLLLLMKWTKGSANQLQDRLNEVKQKPLPYTPQKIE